MLEAMLKAVLEEGGAVNAFKPVGMTSHDVVALARRESGGARVGHAGTLDPAACGVLLLLVGGATKLSKAATGMPKAYRAEMTFGIRTSTGDAEGEVVETGGTADGAAVGEEDLLAAAESFKGTIEQTPPMASAVKVGGRRLYKLAHKGLEIERPKRKVSVKEIRVIDVYERDGLRRALLDIECSSGTYIRSLVEDIGASLGVPACVSFLMRTRVGPFVSDDSVSPERLAGGGLARHAVSLDDFLDIIEGERGSRAFREEEAE
ncbi:MAG: tRNA pseudouridine(55) synthase TruB [bacterium]